MVMDVQKNFYWDKHNTPTLYKLLNAWALMNALKYKGMYHQESKKKKEGGKNLNKKG